MKDLKYYVLGKKDSALLKKYFEKFYQKLLKDLKTISEKWILTKEINKLLDTNNRFFILNADTSSLIYDIFSYDSKTSIELLKKEIDIFLKEWLESKKLSMNKWEKIAWTNIKLTTIDNNPFNEREWHPDHVKEWVFAWNWWVKSKKEWLDVYEKSFILLKKIDEWIYDELNQIITKIIPLGTSINKHNSASYKECVGHLYMWYTIDSIKPEINNLEAIIHESSHNKLNLLLQFDPIVLNDDKKEYYSAIRPDARHILGVFLWYHAFAPTIYILMKAYKNWYLWNDIIWFNKIILFYVKTKFLQKIIKKYAILTDLWKNISCEIDYVISQMDILLKELKPTKEQLKEVKNIQFKHFYEVNKNYPYLKY